MASKKWLLDNMDEENSTSKLATASSSSTSSSSSIVVQLSPSPPQVVFFGLSRDGIISFFTRILRMFNYGAIAPVFFLYCLKIGLSELQIGGLLTAILIGDLVITLWLSTNADRVGRKRILILASLLKIVAGVSFAFSTNFYVLVIAGIVGVISTSGGEIGPFMAIEQACLTDSVLLLQENEGKDKTTTTGYIAVLLGWYNAIGYCAQAIGALLSGVIVQQLTNAPVNSSLYLDPLNAYRCIFILYSIIGALLALSYSFLTPYAEAKAKPQPVSDNHATVIIGTPSQSWLTYLRFPTFGLRRSESKYIVIRLSVMFAMDAFAGAFVLQTWIAFWFAQRWNYSSDLVGYLLMGANVVAGISGIAAAYFVKKVGPMLTMIASHLPSNILLIAVPFMPNAWAAGAMLVARFCISQMDVPARQAYVVMVVASDERSAAGGITNIVRSFGMSLAPLALGYLSSASVGSVTETINFNAPWIISGSIKIAYDIILYSLYVCGKGLKANEASAAEKEKLEQKRENPNDK